MLKLIRDSRPYLATASNPFWLTNGIVLPTTRRDKRNASANGKGRIESGKWGPFPLLIRAISGIRGWNPSTILCRRFQGSHMIAWGASSFLRSLRILAASPYSAGLVSDKVSEENGRGIIGRGMASIPEIRGSPLRSSPATPPRCRSAHGADASS